MPKPFPAQQISSEIITMRKMEKKPQGIYKIRIGEHTKYLTNYLLLV